MTDRPMLMSAPMVRAILDGSKTQTRRIVKVQPPVSVDRCASIALMPPAADGTTHERRWMPGMHAAQSCPYGQSGDRLWVRETWQGPLLDEDQMIERQENELEAFKRPEFCVYRATDELYAIDDDGNELGWRPSIHMPRWASRITLEITGVRVERLQEISEEDALEEGITYNDLPNNGLDPMQASTWFRGLWEEINGPGSWDANPWVWVIEFKRVPQ